MRSNCCPLASTVKGGAAPILAEDATPAQVRVALRVDAASSDRYTVRFLPPFGGALLAVAQRPGGHGLARLRGLGLPLARERLTDGERS